MASGKTESRSTKPNIVFIFSDQQRYDTLGCTGNSIIRTPTFDKLAAEGVNFTQAFSSCPICSPYRGQIMTGRYSHANGVICNEYKLFDNQTTIAQALKKAGYRTGYVGKWHLGYGPYTPEKRYGFDEMAAYNCMHNYYKVTYWENEEGPIKIDKWSPTGETDLALRFMQNHKDNHGDQPFMVMMSWGPPHWPYELYPEEYRIYGPEDVELRPNVPKAMAAFAREELAHYYNNIVGLDAEMKRVQAWLEANGLRENTIICYSSDHGDHCSSHGYGKPGDMWLHHTKRAAKATPYEESIHIPFLLSYPAKVKPGQTTDVMFNSVDVMPTLLALAGVEIPEGMQGQNLSHAALGEEGPRPDSVYLQILGQGWPHRGPWVGYWRGLRTDRWVYARWYGSDEKWLFDRQNDPYEMTNLAGNPEYAAIEKQLDKRLMQWMMDTDDPFYTGKRDPKTGILELGQEYSHEKYYQVDHEI